MELKQAVQALAALAQDSRLEIFRRLARFCHDGLAAGQIAKQLDIPPATLSFHLKELTNAGLISPRREGRSLVYALNVETMRVLLGYLMADCCQGRPELCQPDYCGGSCKPKRRRKLARS